MNTKSIKKGCVISGGGAWGAFGGGTLARINEDYDVVAGISTGALMSPLVALNEWGTLKEGYTSVTQKDIFDNRWYRPSPFKKNGNPNIFAILYALIFGNKTIGTTKALRKTIDRFLNDEHFKLLNKNNKEIIVAAQNLRENPSLLHYFTNKDWNNNDLKDWIWASANAPLFMSLISKEWIDSSNPLQVYSGQWTDGGLTELLAINEVYKRGCNHIDVIIHREIKEPNFQSDEVNNLIENAGASYNAMRHDIEFEYLNSKIKYFNGKGVKIRLWWLPRKLSNNSLIFNKKEMLSWWDEGYQTAFDKERLFVFESSSKTVE